MFLFHIISYFYLLNCVPITSGTIDVMFIIRKYQITSHKTRRGTVLEPHVSVNWLRREEYEFERLIVVLGFVQIN